MSDEWELDNYYWKAAASGEGSTLVPKEGDAYIVTHHFDLDNNGEFEYDQEEYASELRFEHLEHDGIIFLRLVPLSDDQENKRLPILLDRYLERAASAGYEIVEMGEHHVLIEKKHYAAALLDQKETKFAKKDAIVARIDVANLDRIRLDPDARKEKVELVLVKTAFRFAVKEQTLDRTFPVLMVIGYANQPASFQEGLPDFHDFLKRIQIEGVVGFEPVAFEEAKAEKDTEEEPSPPSAESDVPPGAVEEGAADPAKTEDSSTPEDGSPQEGTESQKAPAPSEGQPAAGGRASPSQPAATTP